MKEPSVDLKQFVRAVPDFPKPGILFKDITPLLSSPEAFRFAIEQLAVKYERVKIDAIAAAEARGFLLAAPLAYLLKKPLIPLRKPGKLPYQTTSFSYDLEYGSASLHMHVDAFQPGDSVLLVDDVLATGGTMQAACKLVEQSQGKVAGCAFLIELGFLEGAKKLAGYERYSLLTY
jgi:adenine phosphoribosyltransferase